MDKEQGQGQLTAYLTTFLTNLVFTRIFLCQNLHRKEKIHTFAVYYLGSAL